MFFGSTSPVDVTWTPSTPESVAVTLLSDGEGSAFGLALASPGDFNADGIDDLVVGDDRRSVVWYGSAAPTSQAVATLGAGGHHLLSGGADIATGDLDDDGEADVLLGIRYSPYVGLGGFVHGTFGS